MERALPHPYAPLAFIPWNSFTADKFPRKVSYSDTLKISGACHFCGRTDKMESEKDWRLLSHDISNGIANRVFIESARH